MKVIWIVNILVPAVAAHLNKNEIMTATWLENMLSNIKDSIAAMVCYPVTKDCTMDRIEDSLVSLSLLRFLISLFSRCKQYGFMLIYMQNDHCEILVS